jgi:hypothetical protein
MSLYELHNLLLHLGGGGTGLKNKHKSRNAKNKKKKKNRPPRSPNNQNSEKHQRKSEKSVCKSWPACCRRPHRHSRTNPRPRSFAVQSSSALLP